MRRVLISILLIALIALLAAIVINGVDIAGIDLGHSIQEIVNKNRELDNSIAGLNTKIQQEYQLAKNDLDASFRKLQTEKQSYQNTISLTSEEDRAEANKTEEYKLEYLWTNIGLYATNNNLAMKADLSHGSSGVQNQYNIAFTAVGDYIGVSDFVYEIEKNPNLGFRIEEFALVPYSEDYLQATFIIKNVAIDPNSLSKSANVSSGTVTDNTNGDQTTKQPNSIGGVTPMMEKSKDNQTQS